MSCECCKDGCELGYFHIHKSPFGYEICGYDKEGCDTSEDINYCPHCGCLLNNCPLTLDELKEMEGEPVWVKNLYFTGYEISNGFRITCEGYFAFCTVSGRKFYIKDYGKTWFAYRQKVENN